MTRRSGQTKSKADLVVLDWGIGGLSVYRSLQKTFPWLTMIYFSDSGSIPYGQLTRRQMADRLMKVLRRLSKDYGIHRFVIACNAASTALPDLHSDFKNEGFEVIGMIEPTILWLKKNREAVKTTAFIGGRRTVRSGLLQKTGVVGRVAQPLSALIESGILDGPELHQNLKVILKPLKKKRQLILACTHYPAISNEIQAHLPQTKLVDPAEIVVRKISEMWKLKKQTRSYGAATLFLTTGSTAQSRLSAKLAFQVKAKFIKVSL